MNTSLKKSLVLPLVVFILLFNIFGSSSAGALDGMVYEPFSLPDGYIAGYLRDIWGSGANDVYTVGIGDIGSYIDRPLLYHKQGATWSTVDLSIPPGAMYVGLTSVWGSGASDVYAAGYHYDANGNGLPIIYHTTDGTQWTRSSPPLPAGRIEGLLNKIWGLNESDIYAVGSAAEMNFPWMPLIYHKTGESWTSVIPPLDDWWTSGSLTDIWGSSPTNLYAVGHVSDAYRDRDLPLLYRNNGTGWTETSFPLPGPFSKGYLSIVWGNSATNVYVAGAGRDSEGQYKPFVSHTTNGTDWTYTILPLPAGLAGGGVTGMWGTSASDLYIVGYGQDENYMENRYEMPIMYHNDGTGWTEIQVFLPAGFNEGELHGIWGSSADDILIAGSGFSGESGKPLLYRMSESYRFDDVQPTYWASSFIERLYAAGITGGCGVNPPQYCPEGTVTRAQMAVFLERGIHGSSYNPPAVGGGTGFEDVPPDHWAGAWIKQLAADGITGGCGSGSYCPESPVTRAQMAVFLLRFKYGVSYSPPAVGSSTGFTDVDSTHWAGAWIKQLVTEGISAGCGSGNYCPEQSVTRAQMAVFLVRTFNLP